MPSNARDDKPKLRPQNSSSPNLEGEVRRFPKRALAIGTGVSLVGVAALAFALRGPTATPPGSAARSASEVVADTAAPGAAAPGANALGVPALASAAPGQPPRVSGPAGAVTANVPLFGPTPLATTEPAPLGPPPGSNAAGIEASEKLDAKASLNSLNDQGFPDEAEDEGSSRGKSASKSEKPGDTTKPEDVAPWGHGKMHEPTIYRLRLDAPGAKLVGAQEPTGFSVVIPSRKVMESAGGIAKRDARIARVRASNGDSGAQLSFRFKDGVPSYRVRLRKDYVEVLLSAPSKEAETKSSKDTKEKSAPKSESKGAAKSESKHHTAN